MERVNSLKVRCIYTVMLPLRQYGAYTPSSRPHSNQAGSAGYNIFAILGEVQVPVPVSHERRQDQPEALLSYIEKRIKQAVVSGELKPGAKLSPSAVAADLGVSHIPVREALTSLAASGYLEHRPRVGFFVRVLSSDDLADIYHWREILEREAFIMAIPKLTADDIEEMSRLCGQMRKLTGPGQRREYLNLNRQFHFIAFRP